MSYKKVVLLKSHSATQGGLEKHARLIHEAFRQKGADVTWLSLEKSIWPAFMRMEQFDRFCQKWIAHHGADLIFGMDRNRFQTHFRAGNGVHAAFLESRRFTDGPLKRLLCQVNPLHRKILELEKAAFENRGLKRVFANSHFVKEQILHYYKIESEKIEVVHNGVEWEEMHDFSDFSERMGELQILFIGNGYKRKGLDRLLFAMPFVKNGHLSIVGKEKNLNSYLSLVKRLGIERKVSFFGETTQVKEFYKKADVLVIPSFYDPFANVTVEAMAMGLFVVSSKFNGGAEILPKENILSNLFDVEEMAHRLNSAPKKTKESALKIRNSVKYLDFSRQMQKVIDLAWTD
jgi:UDP-glucose:(heptosyl)LPS alpha-1,3-glucosyltransferase